MGLAMGACLPWPMCVPPVRPRQIAQEHATAASLLQCILPDYQSRGEASGHPLWVHWRAAEEGSAVPLRKRLLRPTRVWLLMGTTWQFSIAVDEIKVSDMDMEQKSFIVNKYLVVQVSRPGADLPGVHVTTHVDVGSDGRILTSV